MAKTLHNNVFDAALNLIKNNCLLQVACSAQPLTYADANATYNLGSVTMATTDFTVANGDTSGRKITIAQKAGGTVTTGGTATHVALLDTTNSILLAVNTCTSQVLTLNNPLTFNAWKIELAAPV